VPIRPPDDIRVATLRELLTEADTYASGRKGTFADPKAQKELQEKQQLRRRKFALQVLLSFALVVMVLLKWFLLPTLVAWSSSGNEPSAAGPLEQSPSEPSDEQPI
jgi:hypothetical protein